MKGVKNGKETYYQDWGKYPLLVANYENDIKTDSEISYYQNNPYSVFCVYKIKNGVEKLEREYYESGILNSSFSDTLINGQKLLSFTQFDSTGILLRTGYYLDTMLQDHFVQYYKNGRKEKEIDFDHGVFSGIYKYYYDNGQLWTTVFYKHDKPWEVINNYSSSGSIQNPGNLKNGNGTIIRYDEKGHQLQTENYIDGKLINSGK